MLTVREHTDSQEYIVQEGGSLDRFFGKKLSKRFNKCIHPWVRILESIRSEYRFYNEASISYSSRYNILTVSQNGKYSLVKHEVKVPGSDKSASRLGYRAGLFVEKDAKVTILFVGNHEDYKGVFQGSDKDCFKYLLKTRYPDFYNQLKGNC